MAKDETARRVEEFAVEFDAQCKPIMAKYHEQMARHKDRVLDEVRHVAWRLVAKGLLLGMFLGFVLGVLAGQYWGAG